VAQSYGLKINLICDGNPNFLYYPKECLVSGQLLFKKYVDSIYPLKQLKVKGAKLLLNLLWGSLSESKTFKKTVDYCRRISSNLPAPRSEKKTGF